MRAWKDCGECGGEGYFVVDCETGETRDCDQCAKHFAEVDKVMRVMLMFKNVAGQADNIYRDRYYEACRAEDALWLESLDQDGKARLCDAKRALWTGVQVDAMIKESHKTAEGIRVITDLQFDSISLVDRPDPKYCVFEIKESRHCTNCGRNTDHGFYPPCDLDKPVAYECRGGGMNQYPKWHMWIPEEKP